MEITSEEKAGLLEAVGVLIIERVTNYGKQYAIKSGDSEYAQQYRTRVAAVEDAWDLHGNRALAKNWYVLRARLNLLEAKK